MRTAALSVIVLMALGCSVAPTPTPSPTASTDQVAEAASCGEKATCHYEDITLAFDYPATWRSATFLVVSSFSSDLVYLSTAALSDPCDRTANMTACVRLAATALESNGLLISWRARAWIGWTFDPTKGRALAVGGRQATLEVSALSDACRGIGGVREVVVTIPRPAAGNWMEMDACLAGPDPALAEAQVEAMLSTVRWKD